MSSSVCASVSRTVLQLLSIHILATRDTCRGGHGRPDVGRVEHSEVAKREDAEAGEVGYRGTSPNE